MNSKTQISKSQNILIAIDKFKGSLTSLQAANSIVQGFRNREATDKNSHKHNFQICPMADGGDGSTIAMEIALGNRAKRISIKAHDPIGREILADILLIDDNTAFIEMALFSGLSLLTPNLYTPTTASTYGFGEAIRTAILEYNVKRVILGIGGSATNDGGIGLLSALGFTFSLSTEFPSRSIAFFMKKIAAFSDASIDEFTPGLREVQFEVACDVTNPLLGENGATMIYGPQKGADSIDLQNLEEGMEKWAEAVANWKKTKGDTKDYSLQEGAGAAGGVGFALSAILGAELLPGWKLFSSLFDIESKIQEADYVITGEGSFDLQSISGKLPYGISLLCRKFHKPLYILCGKSTVERSAILGMNIEKIYSLSEIESNLDKSMKNASQLLGKLIACSDLP